LFNADRQMDRHTDIHGRGKWLLSQTLRTHVKPAVMCTVLRKREMQFTFKINFRQKNYDEDIRENFPVSHHITILSISANTGERARARVCVCVCVCVCVYMCVCVKRTTLFPDTRVT